MSDQPGKPERIKTMKPNNEQKENQVALCVELVETKMTRDKRKAQLMVESRQLLATQNYKV